MVRRPTCIKMPHLHCHGLVAGKIVQKSGLKSRKDAHVTNEDKIEVFLLRLRALFGIGMCCTGNSGEKLL